MVNRLKVTAIVFIMFFSMALVSAFEFDNIKGDLIIDETTSKYGKVEIRNSVLGIPFLQLGKVADIELLENTDICGVNCYAEGRTTLYEEGILIDSLRYNPKYSEINNFEVYIGNGLTTEIVKETSCSIKLTLNKSSYTDCNKIDVEKEVINWIPYDNLELEIGTYDWRIEGTKEPYEMSDWLGTFHNVELTMWANWTGRTSPGLIFWSQFENSTGVDLFNEVLGNQNGHINPPATGVVWNSSGKFGRGISMERTTSSGNISDGLRYSFFDNGQNFTFEAWIKTSIDDVTRMPILYASDKFSFEVKDGKMFAYDFDAAANRVGATDFVDGDWHHVAFVYNNENATGMFYIDGVRDNAFDYQTRTGQALVWLGDTSAGGGTGFVGTIDDLKTWNITRTAHEIQSDMLQDGVGAFSVVLVSPTDEYKNLTSIPFIFNCSSEVAGSGIAIQNVTLYGNWSGDWHANETLDVRELNSKSVMSTFTKNLSIGTYDWNCLVWNNFTADTNKFATSNRTVSSVTYFENSITYNSTAHETASETFILNLSSGGSQSITAALFYNGTEYTATKTGDNSEMEFKSTFDLPTTGNKSFYWDITADSITTSSTTSWQNVINTTLILCNATYPTAFINFTFQDEADLSKLNASVDLVDADYWLGGGTVTKNLNWLNSTENPNYAFCFTPREETITSDITIKYSATGYPQRTFSYDDISFNNDTTNKTLYLLATADGIYSSISVVTATGAPLSGVLVQVEREISGTFTLITQGTTDSSGLVTFWVNPNYVHRITAVKVGYTSVQVSITPSQSLYTITMSTGVGDSQYNSSLEGLRWEAYPGSGTLNKTISQAFNATVWATEGLVALENCKFELLNSSDITQVLATTTSFTNATYCQMKLTYTTRKDENIFGRLSVDTDRTDGFVIVDTDWKWIVMDIDTKAWRTITSFFSELKDIGEFGEGNEAEFSRIMFFFIITTILIGVFTYFSGVELSSPGAAVLIIWPIIIIASVAGFLSFESGTDNIAGFFEQYGFAIISTMYVVGFMLNKLRKSMD